MKTSTIKIGKRSVGKNCLPLIIAEIGINHSGSLEKAIKIADEAITSGAEVIKHQTHILDDEYSYHAKRTFPGNSDKSIYEIIKKNSGQILKTEEWGLRNFSHEINKNKKGFYFHIKFEGIGKTVEELEKAENIDETLIRFLTVRVKKHDLEKNYFEKTE